MATAAYQQALKHGMGHVGAWNSSAVDWTMAAIVSQGGQQLWGKWTQSPWLEPLVFYHWAITTEQPSTLTLVLYCTSGTECFWINHTLVWRLVGAQYRNTDSRNTDGWNTDSRNTDSRNTDSRNTDGQNTDSRNSDSWNSDSRNSDSWNSDSLNSWQFELWQSELWQLELWQSESKLGMLCSIPSQPQTAEARTFAVMPGTCTHSPPLLVLTSPTPNTHRPTVSMLYWRDSRKQFTQPVCLPATSWLWETSVLSLPFFIWWRMQDSLWWWVTS